jgi:hypothetical protein
MKYFLGGYYLVKLRPIDFGTYKGSLIYTCSDCINDSLLENWSFPWAIENERVIQEEKERLEIDGYKINELKNWVAEKLKLNLIGCPNVFVTLESVLEYRQTFFPHLEDLKIIAIYFDEYEASDLVKEFESPTDELGEFGLRLTLLKRIEDIEDKDRILLGYDIIGVESGGDFHTFHCNNLATKLSEKFGLKLNKYGLFNQTKNWKPVTEFLNSKDAGAEPVAWFVAKVKLITSI